MPIVAVREQRFDVAGVVFDKDGTLLDLNASWGPVAAAWVHGVAAGDQAIVDLLCVELGLDLDTGRLRPDSSFAAAPIPEIGDDTRTLLLELGWHRERIEVAVGNGLAAVNGITHDHHISALVDVSGVLGHLRGGGLHIGLFTSDDPEPTRRFLDLFDIWHLFDAVITVADVECAKPDPEGLHLIAERLRVDASRLLMVGDSIADRDAARAAGAHFVAVGHDAPAAAGADATVEHVGEITVPGIAERPGG